MANRAGGLEGEVGEHVAGSCKQRMLWGSADLCKGSGAGQEVTAAE